MRYADAIYSSRASQGRAFLFAMVQVLAGLSNLGISHFCYFVAAWSRRKSFGIVVSSLVVLFAAAVLVRQDGWIFDGVQIL